MAEVEAELRSCVLSLREPAEHRGSLGRLEVATLGIRSSDIPSMHSFIYSLTHLFNQLSLCEALGPRNASGTGAASPGGRWGGETDRHKH